MKNKCYIKTENLPPRLPTMATLFWWMFLDYVNAPQWLFGVIGTMIFILWIIFFYEVITKKAINIFDKNEK